MSRRARQVWAIEQAKSFKRDMRKLPREARAAVFASMRRLLEADNPTRAAEVMPVRGMEDVWRIHADSERAELRVFFSLSPGALIVGKTDYRGFIYFINIRRKDGSTYKFD